MQDSCRNGRANGSKVVAIHIDYGNRKESAEEASFLQGWCAEQGVVCCVRRISEVRRGVTPRDEYEKMSRQIRLDAYREAAEAHGFKGVMLGHHRGDIQENVISNIFRRASLLSLSGMSEASTIDGDVTLYRPLLSFPKSDIIAFAKVFGVPYFRDTTPSWSTQASFGTSCCPCCAMSMAMVFCRACRRWQKIRKR